jgi:UDP-4-amino-4,6-dideoxy-N-acetyl-beta-L-altrosamine N-acetyltransferase
MGEHDLEYVLAWRNHSDVRRFMLTQHEITATEHRAWFERASKDKARALLIVEDNQQPVGCVIFSGVESNSTAEWSFYSAPSSRAGTGRLVCSAALDFAFQELGVHKVAGQVLDFNIASMRLHQRFGFTQEGVLRQHSLVDGKHHDLLCFGLLTNEWLGLC